MIRKLIILLGLTIATVSHAALVVENGGVSNILATSATLWSDITDTNDVSLLHTNYICWGKFNGGTVLTNWEHVITNTADLFGTWNTDITGTDPNSLYRMTSASEDTNGISWASSIAYWVTLANAPTGTLPVANITPIEADSNDVLAVHTNFLIANSIATTNFVDAISNALAAANTSKLTTNGGTSLVFADVVNGTNWTIFICSNDVMTISGNTTNHHY
jgi:hypothetical protein